MPEKPSINLVNPESIRTYINKFAIVGNDVDPKLGGYLLTALERPISKHERVMRRLDKLSDNPPEWLTKKWNETTAFHEFKPDYALDEIVQRIKDWIRGAIGRGDEWLTRTDAVGRPLKLLKLGSLDQALLEVDKDALIQQRKILGHKNAMLGSAEDTEGDIIPRIPSSCLFV